MFELYSEIQADEIICSEYPDGCDYFFAIYAPYQMYAFTECLKYQTHWKYQWIQDINQFDDYCFDGLIVITEDVTCVPNTLGVFAESLKNGADYVTSDFVYGVAGRNICRYSEKTVGVVPHVFAVSKEILQKEKQIFDNSRIEEWAKVIDTFSLRKKHIKQLLFWYHRPLEERDIPRLTRKRVCLFSHELSLTGAPLVLAEAARCLQKNDWQVIVFSLFDGSCSEEFINENAIVLVDFQLTKESEALGIAMKSDWIIVNTVVMAPIIHMLDGMPTPVLWWIHEGMDAYSIFRPMLPIEIKSNIRVACVSELSRDIFHLYCPKIRSNILRYPLKQLMPTNENMVPFSERYVFVLVGAVNKRKGQDILCKAIRLLPDLVRKKCIFRFVGSIHDKEVMDTIEECIRDFPSEVEYLGVYERNMIADMYRVSDCVICASREDPFPVVVVEGWMFGIPCICSKNTGMASIIEKNGTGLVYSDNSPEMLAKRIEDYLCINEDKKIQMSKKCREVFSSSFSDNSFYEELNKLMADESCSIQDLSGETADIQN